MKLPWLPLCLSPLLGVVATLGFAPYGLWPLTIVALAVLLFLARGATAWRAALLGWLFGIANFASGIYWIFISTHVYGAAPAWLSITLCTLLFSYMALYPALAIGLAARWRLLDGPSAWFGVPALWILGEMLRGWVGSGFPWLLLGYIWTDTPFEKLAPLMGVHGLSAVVMLSALALLHLVRGVGVRRLLPAAALSLLAIASAGLGADLWTQPTGTPLSVAIVQGNVPQDEKWNSEHLNDIVRRYREMALQALGTQLIVWPETALPYPLAAMEGPFLEDLDARLRHGGSTLLMGVLIVEEPDVGKRRLSNSAITVGDQRSRYDKRHLVPFGEYFPIPDFLRPLMDVLGTPYSDFSSGPATQGPMEVAGRRLYVNICFEDVFASEFRRDARNADILVNLTNDAWFGDSSAPHQHLQISRMRALETGRWLVRSANTGISAVIDADGRLVARSDQFRTETLRAEVPSRRGSTPYDRYGDVPLWLLSAVVVAGLSRRRSKPGETKHDRA